MSLKTLAKGTPDWHTPLNENFEEIEQRLQRSVPKPESTAAGILYQNDDGTTSVVPTIPKEQYVYGVVIKNDANPSAVYYIEDNVGFVPASSFSMGTWDSSPLYRDIKPCVLNANGTVKYYLQKNDYTKKEDGTASVITGADGNVMVEFPKLFWEIKKAGEDLYVRIGNYKFSDTAVCYAHTDGVNIRDKMYVGAYKTSGALGNQSVSGNKPTASQNISWFRNASRSVGVRWNMCTFYSKILLEILALVMYKGRDLQNLLGKGFTIGNTTSATTGTTNTETFCFGYRGLNDGKQQMKFLGIEDFYGNMWEFIDGLVSDRYTFKTTKDASKFNDLGTGYETVIASSFSAVVSGLYVTEVIGNNDFGFLAKTVGGSEVTYYSDGFWIDNTSSGKENTIALFGGNWNSAGKAGCLYWTLNTTASYADTNIGARLCFL